MLQRAIDKARDEIAIVWGTFLVGVTALQTQAVDLPDEVSIAAFVGSAILTFWGIRTAVTPNSKVA